MDYCAEVECIRNIKLPLLRLAEEQREALCQYETDTSCECICTEEDNLCERFKRCLPSIISSIIGLVIIVYLCLYFGDILCNKDKPFVHPPAF